MGHYVDMIMNMARGNWAMTAVISLFLSYIENFIPMLPISLIVAGSAYVNGLLLGFATTWLGSVLGCISVYSLLKRLEKTKFIMKLKDKHIGENHSVVSRIRDRCFGWLFFLYMLPILPTFLTTILSAYADLKKEEFLPPMIFGKFIMMFFLAYVGSDFKKLINDPKKIVVMIVVVVVSYLLANRLKKKILAKEEKNLKNNKNIGNKDTV